MEKLFKINYLLDFYGAFITNRQNEIMHYHYNQDYSLKEIAEHLNISRQGVFDGLKKAEATLIDMENKLGLLKKHREIMNILQEVISLTESIKKMAENQSTKDEIDKLENWLKKITF